MIYVIDLYELPVIYWETIEQWLISNADPGDWGYTYAPMHSDFSNNTAILVDKLEIYNEQVASVLKLKYG